MTQALHKVADALRKVASSIDAELGEGQRSWQIDAEDLIQTLLSVADQLDPPVTDREPSSEDT